MMIAAMVTLRIDQVDMHYRDSRALELLKSKTNPQTNRAEITVHEMARILECGTATVNRILRRLESAGLIKRHHKQGRSGAEIEVLCQASKNTSSS